MPSPDPSAPAARPRVVLGVGGGIAAYKACEVLRRFTESGHDVTPVPTAAALEFVGAPTWAALSGKPVASDVWAGVHEVPHVRIGKTADLVVVAPATADLLAKAAHGLADDLLTNTLLTARCPIVMVPAMHTEMWEHPATVANVATLRARGILVVEPAEGRLTGKDTGKGRLPDPGEIFEVASDVLARSLAGGAGTDLAGRRVVVSAGGTREYLDPVRFLGNRSSGRQGHALARAALSRGAEVVLVAANVDLPDPAGARVVRVETTAQLAAAVTAEAKGADAVVMAAAPADFRPAAFSDAKIKKLADGSAAPLELVQNADILAGISHERPAPGVVVVGFAAETGDATGSVLELGRQKLARKGCDLLVVNDVSGGAVFGSTDNEAVILGADGSTVEVPRAAKGVLAHAIWDQVVPRLPARP
ncbi:bifunctional phosphopantothenoylcysteine decarboxylase/phosphopantothenate--cysteine ligase CoaBC [Nocardioides sp. ChNu-153]|uniref:bifunctional phosphopantothenoylcysteine decarboxylase/phosphopantothenate--cysteine ligase CoaBC n=1 Tax=unclassified Nocardioides TaxID=2615069 RepID=UPI002406DF66|nr:MULTISPECIES: bifunctional phosphopantothenoylcysteine decarboxylase/phosphopantothenate--cysteine ligase CoaBC [unclassified Nocardioides]MDF9717589.1 bifunctional phosphopantothenoylcysteine decarboxylase/phosphopantothenate--cysteine ligase CoaBC [Nocardioides sp. ChNu-99]MDN7123009.1 bifunctional phosphopantothenoylcysteine decarboxylase/phosphopantothenate--cysteine ligase CoaBC [Nocardioides sp. ChNu-153]